jgi:hypothetical protein
MRILFSVSVLTLLLLLTGCPYGYKYDDGKFPSDPVNISMLNSMYDDYNMYSPIIESERFLYFSSNRDSYGEEYNIVGSHFRVYWDRNEGILQVDDKEHSWKDFSYTDTLFSMMNSPNNEFGPYSLPYYYWGGLNPEYTDLIIYSNDETGNLELKFVYFRGTGENPSLAAGETFGPSGISFLNSEDDDAYLSFFGDDFILEEYGPEVREIQELYFCSDRNGDFDIFKATVPGEKDLVEFLKSDTVLNILPENVLNSTYQDKCPFINGKLLVFTSDRPGGFGGFDLYYSVREGNTWTEPRNFGGKINTDYDEYRPIALLYYEFDDDLLLFSSDRPGGKGGYDLYYVGIPSMIE